MALEGAVKPQCPFIVFRLGKELFTLNSEIVSSIMILPHLEAVPDAPGHVPGLFTYRGEAVPAVDLRPALGMHTLKQDYEDFTRMLDARKQDHINWVNELDRCIKTGDQFRLATDPHQCKFGKWYDHFDTDNQAVKFHLKKIDEPHRKLHETAHALCKCSQQHSQCKRKECLKVTFARAEDNYMPAVLNLLEETKEIMRDSYREMVLVLGTEGHYIGAIVDEVLSVEELENLDGHNMEQYTGVGARMVIGVRKSARLSHTILELDADRLYEGVVYH